MLGGSWDHPSSSALRALSTPGEVCAIDSQHLLAAQRLEQDLNSIFFSGIVLAWGAVGKKM
jgi:hypothetical protein